MHIFVNIRESTLRIELGSSSSRHTHKWLALTATSLYAAQLSGGSTNNTGASFLPVHLTDMPGNILQPSALVCDHLSSGATVRLDITGPQSSSGGVSGAGGRKEESLWQLHAFAQQKEYTPIVILYDAGSDGASNSSSSSTSQATTSNPPHIHGNFTNWHLHRMTYWRDSIWKYESTFPAGAQLVWKFVVGVGMNVSGGNIQNALNGATSVLTPSVYPLIHDEHGNKLHYLVVSPIPPMECLDVDGVCVGGSGSSIGSTTDLTSKSTSLLTTRSILSSNQHALEAWLQRDVYQRNGKELKVCAERIVGKYPGGGSVNGVSKQPSLSIAISPSRTTIDRLLERDLLSLIPNLSDVFPSSTSIAGGRILQSKTYPTRVAELQQTVGKYYSDLYALYTMYASVNTVYQQDGIISNPGWNKLLVALFCGLLKLSESGGTSTMSMSRGASVGSERVELVLEKVIEREQNGGNSNTSSNSSSSNEVTSTPSTSKWSRYIQNLFSSYNVLTRGMFLSFIVRVAMMKYKNPVDGKEWEGKSGTEKGGKQGQSSSSAQPQQPTHSLEPNPSLSLELLMKHYLLPFIQTQIYGITNNNVNGTSEKSSAGGVGTGINGKSGGASKLSAQQQQQQQHQHHPQSASLTNIHSSNGISALQTHQFRLRCLQDKNVWRILAAYSEELRECWGKYTNKGGIGGSATNGSAAGRVRSASARTSSFSQRMSLRSLEAMLNEFDLILDPSQPMKTLAMIGVQLDEVAVATAAASAGVQPTAAGGSSSSSATAAADVDVDSSVSNTELTEAEWLEVLLRIADTGLAMKGQQQSHHIGSTRPVTSSLKSLQSAGHSHALHLDDGDGDSDHDHSRRILDDTELCERLAILMRSMFPSESERAERRARLAAQQAREQLTHGHGSVSGGAGGGGSAATAQSTNPAKSTDESKEETPVIAPTTKESKVTIKKVGGAGAAATKGTAATASARTPAKKIIVKK